MDTLTTVIVVIVVVAAVAFFAYVEISAWRIKHGRIKVKPVEYECDRASCDHRWEHFDSGTCTTSYSSYGGCDPQETWTVEYCPRCGAKTFSCTGSCDSFSECAAPYEL